MKKRGYDRNEQLAEHSYEKVIISLHSEKCEYLKEDPEGTISRGEQETIKKSDMARHFSRANSSSKRKRDSECLGVQCNTEVRAIPLN